MLLFLVDYPEADRYDTGSLKKIFFAGAPVTPVVYERAVKRFGNVFSPSVRYDRDGGQTTILKTRHRPGHGLRKYGDPGILRPVLCRHGKRGRG